MAANFPIEVVSEDPEVLRLQSIIRGLKHISSKKTLTPDHFRVLAGVELACKVLKQPATIPAIESFVDMKTKQVEDLLTDLVESKYVHEVVNKYGALNIRYKLGALGGTSMRVLLNRSKKSPVEDLYWLNELQKCA